MDSTPAAEAKHDKKNLEKEHWDGEHWLRTKPTPGCGDCQDEMAQIRMAVLYLTMGKKPWASA